MRRIRRLFASTRGQAIIIAAIALPALAGSAALAVDVGHIYVAKSAIQNAVDAGSRAGAAILASGGTQAEASAEATSFASQNLTGISCLASATPVITFPTSTSVNVAIDHSLDLFFAPVVGINSTNIAAGATAALASVSAVGENELVPLAIYCNNSAGCAGVLAVGQNYALRAIVEIFSRTEPLETAAAQTSRTRRYSSSELRSTTATATPFSVPPSGTDIRGRWNSARRPGRFPATGTAGAAE